MFYVFALPEVSLVDGKLRPSLDESWDDDEKLAWWAAVVRLETGINVMIRDSDIRSGGEKITGFYDVITPGRSRGGTYEETKEYLMKLGAGIS